MATWRRKRLAMFFWTPPSDFRSGCHLGPQPSSFWRTARSQAPELRDKQVERNERVVSLSEGARGCAYQSLRQLLCLATLAGQSLAQPDHNRIKKLLVVVAVANLAFQGKKSQACVVAHFGVLLLHPTLHISHTRRLGRAVEDSMQQVVKRDPLFHRLLRQP